MMPFLLIVVVPVVALLAIAFGAELFVRWIESARARWTLRRRQNKKFNVGSYE